jgi:DMSO/TMAO reductase YedYZ molybdopterin-dependent catalytic subunit
MRRCLLWRRGYSEYEMNLFQRRNKDREEYGDRLPPGQKLTDGWPVLHYGTVPKIDLDTWRLEVTGMVENPLSLSWQELNALPEFNTVNDIHCVTAWSKFDNNWTGISVQEVLKLARPNPDAKAVMVHSYGGYTTNLLMSDLMMEGNLFAHTHDGQPLTKEHGWPMRLVVPHLYFWKSAKWVHGLVIGPDDRPGFWEMYGYHMRGDPWKEERYS